jgi:hypothetical protein
MVTREGASEERMRPSRDARREGNGCLHLNVDVNQPQEHHDQNLDAMTDQSADPAIDPAKMRCHGAEVGMLGVS